VDDGPRRVQHVEDDAREAAERGGSNNQHS
jgi:hypothetical protein